ncbi:hypothetical protein AVEN_221107-1 [Araneus ventricosus]|uniref:Uncharacterized protein n=1 Tax=Araneus ventricosus TaxID=182803 RepID=A0A4Y2UTU0_ARAVE|nr:hypothetical protein AVEN_221107-1 [Araneus ventricosus]
MTTAFLHFIPLLHDARCLPSDSPAQLLLQLITGCEPVTLLFLPQRCIVLCTSLPADSSPPTRPIFPTETVSTSLLSQQVKFISLMSVMLQDTQVVGFAAPMNCASLQQLVLC